MVKITPKKQLILLLKIISIGKNLGKIFFVKGRRGGGSPFGGGGLAAPCHTSSVFTGLKGCIKYVIWLKREKVTNACLGHGKCIKYVIWLKREKVTS